ncbi:MAG: hypothetical protein ACK56I_05020, partial [bacterium]
MLGAVLDGGPQRVEPRLDGGGRAEAARAVHGEVAVAPGAEALEAGVPRGGLRHRDRPPGGWREVVRRQRGRQATRGVERRDEVRRDEQGVDALVVLGDRAAVGELPARVG